MNSAELFENIYSTSPEVLSKAPGRLEVLGNHTDYNEGYVLSVAVDAGTEMAFVKTEGTTCKVHSPVMGDGVRMFDLDDIKQPLENRDWTNYIRGVINEMQKRGYEVGAFNAVITSNMPLSAGMSSSASIEMALVSGLCELFDLDIPLKNKARIGQGCENNYIGANTGLMDQLSSLTGKKNQLVVSEFRNVTVNHTPIPEEIALVVVNSGVTHDLSCEYNERREMCEEACDVLKTVYPGVTALRDVTLSMLEEQKELLSENAYKRARHITEENKRVKEAQDFLASGDISQFGRLLFDSHQSSMDNFENSCEELDFLVKTAKESGQCLGARLSGGGFGGISIHLVKSEDTPSYVEFIKSSFEDRFKKTPDTYVCRSADGAQAVRLKGCSV